MDFNEKTYTTEEVAKRYRVQPLTVQRWVRDGRITALNLGGRRNGPYVFRLGDLKDFEMAAAVGKVADQKKKGAAVS